MGVFVQVCVYVCVCVCPTLHFAMYGRRQCRATEAMMTDGLECYRIAVKFGGH